MVLERFDCRLRSLYEYFKHCDLFRARYLLVLSYHNFDRVLSGLGSEVDVMKLELAAMLKRGTRPKPWHGAQDYAVIIIITICLVLVVTSVLLFRHNADNPHPTFQVPNQKWNAFESLVKFNPTREFRNGTDFIWQIPDSPKAVLFMAHGCHGRAVDFWDSSPNCPECVGLPEERLLTLHALARKFAVITISSARSRRKCWTYGEETVIVKDMIKWWAKRNKLDKLPLVAFGASSGGFFVSVIASELRCSCIVLMISEGVFEQMEITDDYPPTLFVHMPKDRPRQQKISEFVEVFRSKGIDVAEVECIEFPLLPTLFSDRIPGLDPIVSAKLFELFKVKGFVDEDGYMRRDGRATRWKHAVTENNIDLPEKLFKHVGEELNLAYANHEMTSLPSDQIFKWFESHLM